MHIEEYKALAAGQELLEKEFGDAAYKIADEITHGRLNRILRFEVDRVVYEYNGSCGCHPTNDTEDFPSSWLFDPDWRMKWEAQKDNAKEAAQQTKAQEEAKAKRAQEAEERKTFEKLKTKYEPSA